MAHKIDVVEYEFEILEYIKNNPSGVSITDVANDKKYSRNTVSKYLSILTLKNLVYSKKVGTSKLYFTSKTSNLPSTTVISYYKGVLKGMKKYFPFQEEIFKKIGREAAHGIQFSFGPKIFKQLSSLKGNPISEIHFEMFKNFYSSYDILQPDLDITLLKIEPKDKKVIFRFKKSRFVEDSDDYIYHIYISCGITEAILTRELEKPVEVSIQKIVYDINKENSYFDISIQIKEN